MTKTNKKKEKVIVLGIDLGTTFCVVSEYTADEKVELFKNTDGKVLTPSIVNLQDEANPVVGRTAENAMRYAMEFIARLFKRQMGKADSQGNPLPAFLHPASDNAYSPEALSGLLMSYLVKGVEEATGNKVGGVVITVPAYFDSRAREATKKAGELAGVKVLGIINEPTAAALAYGLEKSDGDETRRILVYDLGGGTFDVTVLEISDGEYEVLATDGNRDLGGQDINDLIKLKVIERFKEETKIEIKNGNDPLVDAELEERVERAKKDLSQAQTTAIIISAQGQHLQVDLTRQDSEGLISPIVEKTKAITLKALEAAGLDWAQINDVVLVGGSTRIPVVRKMLEDLSGQKPLTSLNPDEAVARGAAIYAAKIGTQKNLMLVDSEGQKVLPPAIELRERTSHPLGVLAYDEGSDSREERCSVIIPAGTEIPCEKEKVYGLERADQKNADIKIVRGIRDAPADQCTPIRQFSLSDLKEADNNSSRIRIVFGFTAEGILTVRAEDRESDKIAQVEIGSDAELTSKTD